MTFPKYLSSTALVLTGIFLIPWSYEELFIISIAPVWGATLIAFGILDACEKHHTAIALLKEGVRK